MQQVGVPQPDYETAVRCWRARAPLYRRALARIGLPGKLIAAFLLLLMVGLAGSSWLFVHESREILSLSRHRGLTDAALRRAEAAIILCSSLSVLLSVPLVMGVVHRIFEPIRQLVAAADKISDGDLTARVAIYRPDAIGMLARSFNTMAHRVRQQQQALEDANLRLERANVELEQRIAHRTAQLEAANNRLNLEIAEKEDFLRAISHDLSAPLRNISGMATMLLHKKRQDFDEDVVHRLERIQKNVDVEAGLISELVELSNIKTNRHRMSVIDLTELVNDVAGVFESDLQSRSIRFMIDTPLPLVRCEKPRLRRVFQNLIDNAIKFMGDGAGEHRTREIHVGAAVRPDEIEFYVRDTGIGFDAEDREAIFYVFRRGRNAAARAIAGRGVGLAIVKSIVQTYSGAVWAEAAPDGGSIFRFTINAAHFVASGPLTGAA